jgi:hypothetical protein
MTAEDFYAAVEKAKRIEREMLPYSAFNEKIDVMRTIEFYPKEYQELSYTDLLNFYEYIQKVIKASRIEIYAQAEPTEIKTETKAAEEDKTKRREVEMKVKEITQTSLEKAEEMKAVESIEKLEEKTKVIEEKPSEKKEDETLVLEFERPEKEEEAGKHQEQHQITPPIEKKKEIQMPAEEGVNEAKPPIPEVLEVAAEEAASKKYEEIEEYLKREFGGEIDEQKIKKKMLELTKNLFKEKSVHARDKIKTEIAALKGILIKLAGKRKKATIEKMDYSPAFFESLVGAQTSELTAIKDSIASRVNNEIEDIKKRFYDKLAETGEERTDERRAAYEKFVFQLTSISEALGDELSKHKTFIMQKHISEIEQFISKLPKEEKKLMEKAQERLSTIKHLYEKEFATLQEILTKKVEGLIESGGQVIFKEEKVEGEEKKEKAEETSQILFEINETDEATLLYYLHSKSPDTYKKYERKRISRHEAIHYAKILMAKEKGLSDDIITKYFGQVEIEEEKR